MKVLVWLSHRELPCFEITADQIDRLRGRLPEAEIVVARDEAPFLELLPDARVAVVWRFEQDWIERAAKLEWIITPAAGRDYFHVTPPAHVDLEYCSFHGEIIAETVIGMLLSHCRGLTATERLGREHAWPRRELSLRMRPLRGSHVVIVGFGNIGRWIGRLLKPFGVSITGVRRTIPEDALPEFFDENDSVVKLEELDDRLPHADYVVVALPRDPSTDHLIDAGRLSHFSPDAVLVNVGRGNAVDEAALVEALRSRSIAAAYLDVFEIEPLAESSPLRDCDNAFLMPHASAFSPSYLTLFVDEFAERFLERYGGPA